MKPTIAEIKKKIVPILKKNDVKHAAIFGSFARGEATKKSDVDVLIEYKNDNKSLFDFIDLQLDLQKKLHRKVDLADYEMLKPRIKDKILKERVSIL